MSMLFTVALCTHNHADRLTRTLVDLEAIAQPENSWELLIVDNACTDGTTDLLRLHRWPKAWSVRVVREDRLGLSNARNRAAAEAHGAYTIFIDDDETPAPGWLCAYERLVRSRRPDAIGGRIKVMFEDTRPSWLADELLAFLGELHHGEQSVRLDHPDKPFFGGNFGCRTELIPSIGGFDPMLGRQGRVNVGGEEIDFYRRLLAAGSSVWWTPEATIHHRVQASKLTRGYFLDLHFRQGGVDALRDRGDRSRVPPRYLWPQLVRAYVRALRSRIRAGADRSLRSEMNAAYFTGYVAYWLRRTA